jgi:rhodanese-related sulfurtransferase
METVDRREAKDALYEAFATAAKALANGHRAEIVDVLAQGERSVDEISREIAQSVANTSHHLHVLAFAGLVRSRREGKRIYYRLSSDRVVDLWTSLREVAAEHVATVEILANDYLGDRGAIEQVSADELNERLRQGRVVLVDVRPTTEFASGHITGARSAPIDRLDALISDLPRNREVIAYCRGPYCVYADDAVRLLRARGLRARRLDVGYPEWRRMGLPTENTEQTA